MSRYAPFIHTRSGGPFWFLEPKPKAVNINDIAHALSHLCRYTGHCRDFYSVAEHSYHVSQIVPQEFALEALLHDGSEAYLGDVASPLKEALPGYKAIEERVEWAVRARFGLPSEMTPEVKRGDVAMLIAEFRQLMPNPLTTKFDVPDPKRTVWCFPPAAAKALFLERFVELTRERVAA